jgi:hypothetical protein
LAALNTNKSFHIHYKIRSLGKKDMNHKKVATRVESISMASGIIAGISAAGATIAAPSGFDAFGVFLGITDEPFIIIAAPVLGIIATAAGTLSGVTYFFSLWKSRQTKDNEL